MANPLPVSWELRQRAKALFLANELFATPDRNAASTTWRGWRMLATMTSVENA